MRKKIIRDISAVPMQVIIILLSALLILCLLSKNLTKNNSVDINGAPAVIMTIFPHLGFGIDQMVHMDGMHMILSAFFVSFLVNTISRLLQVPHYKGSGAIPAYPAPIISQTLYFTLLTRPIAIPKIAYPSGLYTVSAVIIKLVYCGSSSVDRFIELMVSAAIYLNLFLACQRSKQEIGIPNQNWQISKFENLIWCIS